MMFAKHLSLKQFTTSLQFPPRLHTGNTMTSTTDIALSGFLLSGSAFYPLVQALLRRIKKGLDQFGATLRFDICISDAAHPFSYAISTHKTWFDGYNNVTFTIHFSFEAVVFALEGSDCRTG
jgi:hypothetical protein